MFGGLGMGEMILIFLVVLLLFGAKRLPEIGKSMGVDGTPALYTADGEHVGGYMAPDQLVERLDQIAQKSRAVTAK